MPGGLPPEVAARIPQGAKKGCPRCNEIPDANAVSCAQKDCNTVACNPTTGNCDYTPKAMGTVCGGAAGCFTVSTCDATGHCLGTARTHCWPILS